MPARVEFNNMTFSAFSLVGATISLQGTILLLGAALFLDYRRARRRRWLLGRLESLLQGDSRPVLVDLGNAA
jgi:hypothetical protein